MSQDFWDRNWEVAAELGEPTPPIKGVNELTVRIYCSEMRQRAVDRGFKCTCGCTEMLRAQKQLMERYARKTREQELPVMGWVKPRKGTKAWNDMKQDIVEYHTKENDDG